MNRSQKPGWTRNCLCLPAPLAGLAAPGTAALAKQKQEEDGRSPCTFPSRALLVCTSPCTLFLLLLMPLFWIKPCKTWIGLQVVAGLALFAFSLFNRRNISFSHTRMRSSSKAVSGNAVHLLGGSQVWESPQLLGSGRQRRRRAVEAAVRRKALPPSCVPRAPASRRRWGPRSGAALRNRSGRRGGRGARSEGAASCSHPALSPFCGLRECRKSVKETKWAPGEARWCPRSCPARRRLRGAARSPAQVGRGWLRSAARFSHGDAVAVHGASAGPEVRGTASALGTASCCPAPASGQRYSAGLSSLSNQHLTLKIRYQGDCPSKVSHFRVG